MNKDIHKFVFEELMDYAEIINGEQNDIHRFGHLFHCKPVFKWGFAKLYLPDSRCNEFDNPFTIIPSSLR